jgi:hypothetical protein
MLPILFIQPMDCGGIEYIGPFKPISRAGSRYILVYTDYFTKYMMAIPVKVITLSNMELEEGGYPDEILPCSPPSLSHLGKETSLRSGQRVTHGATLTVSQTIKSSKADLQIQTFNLPQSGPARVA